MYKITKCLIYILFFSLAGFPFKSFSSEACSIRAFKAFGKSETISLSSGQSETFTLGTTTSIPYQSGPRSFGNMVTTCNNGVLTYNPAAARVFNGMPYTSKNLVPWTTWISQCPVSGPYGENYTLYSNETMPFFYSDLDGNCDKTSLTCNSSGQTIYAGANGGQVPPGQQFTLGACPPAAIGCTIMVATGTNPNSVSPKQVASGTSLMGYIWNLNNGTWNPQLCTNTTGAIACDNGSLTLYSDTSSLSNISIPSGSYAVASTSMSEACMFPSNGTCVINVNGKPQTYSTGTILSGIFSGCNVVNNVNPNGVQVTCIDPSSQSNGWSATGSSTALAQLPASSSSVVWNVYTCNGGGSPIVTY